MATTTDPTPAMLDELDAAIAPIALEFVNTCRSPPYLLPVVITSARRSPEQQAQLVQQGRSRTLASKHVQGLAFDIDLFHWSRDAVPRWVWDEVGPLAEELGLTWGGRWTSFVDVGHFEI